MTPRPQNHLADLVDGLVANAFEAGRRGDVEEARRLAGEALRHDPDNRDAVEIAQLGDRPPAELRRLTILFCDLVGSTAMSVRHDPGEYGPMLEVYHRHCGDVIVAHGGRVTRRVGDGVLALFGHPVSYGDDTWRAVRAALGIVERMKAIRTDLEKSFGDIFEVRVAVHHGPVHLDLTESQVYGLAPNLAARLQELAEPDGVVVSPQVAAIVGDLFVLADHDPVPLRGIDEPIAFHSVEGETPASPRRGRRWKTPFIGRTAELDRLRQFLDRRELPGNSVVVVTGEAGIGKSRLVHEALTEAEALPPRVLMSVCSAYESAREFAAVRSLLHLGPEPPMNEHGARLRQLRSELVTIGLDPGEHLGLLARVIGIDPAAGYVAPPRDLSRIRGLTMESIRAWLTALAVEGLLVRIEDLQWADQASIELFTSLATDPIAGVRVLATERLEETSQSAHHAFDVVELQPLEQADALELAESVSPGMDDAASERVVTLGEGIPLFLEELAGAGGVGTGGVGTGGVSLGGVVSGGVSLGGVVSGGVAMVEPEMRIRFAETSSVPAVLYEPLVARLTQPAVDLPVAQAAATIGVSFERSTLSASLGRSEASVEAAVDALIDAGVVERSGPGAYHFRHALIRDIAYDLQPRADRREMHRRVGEALRARHREGEPGSWAVIALHLHLAGEVDAAVDAYGRAADEARDLGGLVSARTMLTTALGLIEGLAPGEHRRLLEVTIRLRRAFLSVTMAGNADPGALADYEACWKVLSRNPAGPEFVDTLVSMWGYYTAVGSLRRSMELLDDIRATGICADPRYDAQNHGARGLVAFLQGDFRRAGEAFEAAELVRPEESYQDERPARWQFPNDPLVVEHAFRAALAWQLMDMAGNLEHRRRARQRAESLAFPYGPFSLCYALFYAVWVDIETGAFDSALRTVEELTAVADRHGFDFWSVSGQSMRSTLAACMELSLPAPDRTLLRLENERQNTLRSVITLLDARSFIPFGLTKQAVVVNLTDGPGAALELLDHADAIAERTGSAFYMAETCRMRALVLRAHDPARADAALRRALDTARAQGAVCFARRALDDLQASSRDTAGA